MPKNSKGDDAYEGIRLISQTSKVDIYFTVVGMMSIPDEKEIQAMMEEMKNNLKSPKLVS